MSWRVARSLDTLLGEINAAAPDRSKLSDGSIGDAAHASRSSDHNPWVVLSGVGIVRARDFTHDPAGGLDCQRLADHLTAMLRAGQHPALGSGAYVIWRSRILSRDRLSEGWRAYSGSNPHDKHLHLSVATSAAGFDSTRPWGWGTSLEDDDMPYTEKQLTDIVQAAVKPLLRDQTKTLVKRVKLAANQTRKIARQLSAKERAELEKIADELEALGE